ncbi:hypothetical protein GGS24DRAFT_450571 [Hypoxylon argillaceum]|nr:hypothetical protein GGS24DRAFT_450571 [Hypoxylon argillaceum]
MRATPCLATWSRLHAEAIPPRRARARRIRIPRVAGWLSGFYVWRVFVSRSGSWRIWFVLPFAAVEIWAWSMVWSGWCGMDTGRLARVVVRNVGRSERVRDARNTWTWI